MAINSTWSLQNIEKYIKDCDFEKLKDNFYSYLDDKEESQLNTVIILELETNHEIKTFLIEKILDFMIKTGPNYLESIDIFYFLKFTKEDIT